MASVSPSAVVYLTLFVMPWQSPWLHRMCRAICRLDSSPYMDASKTIHDAVDQVRLMRDAMADNRELAQAVHQIKDLQARRFAGSYFDLLHSKQYQPAAQFFLEELYGTKDYAERDAQFVRVAGALERFFPAQVVQTAVSLAQLHCLTEQLDQAMAQSWMTNAAKPEQARYLAAWRTVNRRDDRNKQLATVMEIGHELSRLTKKPSLRLMLKMMRGPASLAGLGSLQQFLEAGFDTFAAMNRQDGGASQFLATVMERESSLIELLFDARTVTCETKIRELLGQPR